MRGVNLGGWLVLEKWITPSLFKDTEANDEYTFCQSGALALSKLTAHHETFITEADFAWLAMQGIEAVRLPIGYWVFGDQAPYIGSIKYVDRVFTWAKKHKLKVLLDMHGAPGSQNGWDHSGRTGVAGWDKDPANAKLTLSVIERLALRYGHRPELLGIELLNEPKRTLAKKPMRDYYAAAYKLIRAHCRPGTWVVIHDNFRPRRWARELRAPGYSDVFIDTHRYQCFSWWNKLHPIDWHLRHAAGRVPHALATMKRSHPVIVGEWSLALDRRSTGALSPAAADSINRAYASAQLLAYDQTSAWFFWTYKTEHSPTWSLRESIERGWLPTWK